MIFEIIVWSIIVLMAITGSKELFTKIKNEINNMD
jgi:hypothetical protein